MPDGQSSSNGANASSTFAILANDRRARSPTATDKLFAILVHSERTPKRPTDHVLGSGRHHDLELRQKISLAYVKLKSYI